MTTDPLQPVYEVFNEIAAVPRRQRLEVLRERCAGNEALYNEVLNLLKTGTLDSGEVLGAGQRIGHYTIRSVLGEGGFAVVYLADQTQPVRRRVALKIIHAGMESRQVVARFEAERQALAIMDHPGVAKVFDAGTTDNGRPYFVMELVQGVPITDHCDRNRLSVRERLGLFIQVCDAVNHAHQKGIIHRDVKPSNVLVTVTDGRAVPKVIDFGVAKALHRHLSDHTLVTERGQIIGTLEYMSPEQAEMTSQDIDTRTDVYALGVLLYQLLTGVLPFDSRALRQAPLAEIQRIIREEEPPKPSTRLSSLGDESTGLAQMRRADARTLLRTLRGDLDWITMKALEKDRTRRYAGPSELAADVARYLNHEPVLAGPPSTVYRVRKFVGRHKVGVLGAAAMLLVLVGGLVASTWGFLEASRARDEAELARDAMQREAQRKEASVEFLVNAISSADPTQGAVPDLTVREMLDRASENILVTTESEPLLTATVRDAIGRAYQGLGRYDEAEDHLRAALELHRALYGAEHEAIAASLHSLGHLYIEAARWDEAASLLEESLAMRRRLRGPGNPAVAESLSSLALALAETGELDRALQLARQAVEIYRRSYGNVHEDVARSLGVLGEVLYHSRDYEAARSAFEQSIDILRNVHGSAHPATVEETHNLAVVLTKLGEADQAERLLLDALDRHRSLFGDAHPRVATALDNLGILQQAWGDFIKSEQFHRDAYEMRRELLGDEHRDTVRSLNNLAHAYAQRGKWADSEAAFRIVLPNFGKQYGEHHRETLNVMGNIGFLAWKQDKLEQAAQTYHSCVELQRRHLPEKSWDLTRNLSNLAQVLRDAGKLTEAEALYREYKERCRRIGGEKHNRTIGAMHDHAQILHDLGRNEEAEPIARACYDLRLETRGPDHADTALTIGLLVAINEALGAPDLAEQWRTKLPSDQAKESGE